MVIIGGRRRGAIAAQTVILPVVAVAVLFGPQFWCVG